MQKGVRKKLSFILIAFFAFAYQLGNVPQTNYKMVEAANTPSVILGGHAIGVNINVGGILVVGISDFEGTDGKKHCPVREAGIKKGDIIVSVNGENVTSSSEFTTIIDQCNDQKIYVQYLRDGVRKNVYVNAVKSAEDGKYRLGLWARDGTTGIGTLTFIDPLTKRFGALGHGVTDVESMDFIEGNGNIYFASVSEIEKNSASDIGRMQGYFISSEIGNVEKNTNLGIFGEFVEKSLNGTEVPTATRHQIAKGDAKMYCCLEGNNVEEFDVCIEKINVNSSDNKSMVIRVNDQELIERTGGIVQGMSGSPLVQNGKLIGAVTHVFVNDPTRGYGIFIENMLAEAEKIK